MISLSPGGFNQADMLVDIRIVHLTVVENSVRVWIEWLWR